MSIDRDALLGTFKEYGFAPGSDPHSWRCYHPDRYGDCSCASDLADAVLALVQPDATCDDLRARLANIAGLRDEMRAQPGGSVVWIDDLDEILDGAHPGAALTRDDIPRVIYALRNQDHTSEADEALAARLEARQ